MNNEYLKLAWQDAVNKGYKNSVDDFYTLLSSNDEWLTRSWNDARDQGYKGDLDSYSRLLGLKKKAETTPEPSQLEQPSPAQKSDSTSVQAPVDTSSVTPAPFVEAKPNEARTLKAVTRDQAQQLGYPDQAWIDSNASDEIEPSFLGRMMRESGRANPRSLPVIQTLDAMARSEGTVGDIFNVLDEAAEGWMRARGEESAINVGNRINDAIGAGEEITDETIQEYLDVLKSRKEFEARYGTDEYYDAFKEAWDAYSEEDGVIVGWFRAISENPAAAFTSTVENLSKQANLTQAVRAGEAALSTIMAMTAAGSVIPGVGNVAGFAAGVAAAIPTAFAWSGYHLERGLETFGAIDEHIQSTGEEVNAETIRNTVNNRELMLDISARANNGAAIIGLSDLLFTGVGGELASAVIKGGLKRGMRTGVATGVSTIATAPVDFIGEGTGEAAKIVFTEEDATLDDIARGFLEEATGNVYGGFKSTASGLVNVAVNSSAPSYTINGKKVSRQGMASFIQNADSEALRNVTLNINNDKKLDGLLSERLARYDIESNIDPSITGADRARMVDLIHEEQKLNKMGEGIVSEEANRIRQATLTAIQEEMREINDRNINAAVENAKKKINDPLADTKPAPAPAPAPIETKKTGTIVDESINRKAVLVEYNGREINQEGDLYVDGQTLVLETDDRIYEIGNVDEVSDMDMAEVGLAPVVEEATVNNDGTIRVDDQNWNIQTDLDNRGIEYDENGNVTRVSLKDNEGKTVMYDGQRAEDIAYQIMLSEIQTPEQEQRVNEALEQDEEFQEQSRLYREQRALDEQSGNVETATEKRSNQDTKQGPKPKVKADKKPRKPSNKKKEESPERSERRRAASEKEANSIYRRMLVANDPKEKAKLLSYARAMEAAGHEFTPEQKELIDDVESRLTQNGYSLGTRVKVGDEWTPQTPGKAVFVPDPTKETGTRTIAQVTNRGLYRDGRVVSPPTYVVKVGTRPVETTNINGNETRTKARDVKTLKEIMSNVFNLPGKRADAAAKIGDRLVANMAKRAGITKEEMYDRLSFGGADSFNEANIVGTLQFQGDKNDVYGISKKFYANAEDFEKDLREGRIVLGGDPANLEGPYVLHVPDTMMSGTMTIGDEQISAEGGVLYPLMFSDENFFWASNESKSMLNALNRAAKQSTDGKVRLMLVSSNRQKLLSNSVAGETILKIFSNKAMRSEFNLSKTELKNAIMAANEVLAPDPVNAPLGAKINRGMSLESMVDQIVSTLSPDNSTFPTRKAFVVALISNVVKVVNSKADPKTKGNKTAKNIVDFFSQMAGVEPVDIYQKRSSSRLNIESVREAIGQMLSEKLLDQVSESDVVYAAIEVDVNPNGDTFTSVNTKAEGRRTHGSYNFAITPVDPNSKPRVIIFDKHRKWYDFTSAENNGAAIGRNNLRVLPTNKGFSNAVYPAAPPSREINVDQFRGNATAAFQTVKDTPIEDENGATFNLDGTTYSGGGTVVPVASMNFDSSDMTVDDISAFMQKYQAAFTADNFVVGIYKFPGENKMSVDINIVVDGKEQIEQGFEFAKYAGQESIFDLSTFEGKKTGNSGKFPKSFSPREISIIARHIENGTIDRFIQQDRRYSMPEHVMNRMTRDSDGNFLFVHYSNEERDVIKRGSGENPVTSSEEASAIGSAGGLAMYYVDTSKDVMGRYPHVKKVPQDKVYYFNEDALNLYDEALDRYKKAYPDRTAFPSPNHQLAWITKVANERGFEMVVSEWSNNLRAQTTKEFAPDSRDPSVMSTFSAEKAIEKFRVGDNVATRSHGDGIVVGYEENTEDPKKSKITVKIPTWDKKGFEEYTITPVGGPGKRGYWRNIRKTRFNNFLLDENGDPFINENPKQVLFQQQRAAVVMKDVEAIIYALNSPDVTSPMHELAHVFENYLTEEEKATILQWTGHESWSTDTSEAFAEGFEKYLSEGVAPDKGLEGVFNSFKKWIREIYSSVKGTPLEIELNDGMRALYSAMVSEGNPDNVVTGRSGNRTLFQDTITKRFRTSLQQTMFWIRVKFADRFARVMKIQEDLIADGIEVYENEDFKMAEELMHGRTANDLEKNVEVYVDRIAKTLKKHGLDVEDLNAYMMALHVKERNAYILDKYEVGDGSGKSDEWADETLAYYAERKYALEEAANHVRDLLQDTRERMVEFGLESQGLVDEWQQTFENYVPLYGFAKDELLSVDEDTSGSSRYLTGGAGIHVAGPTVKKAKGRSTEAANVVGNAVQLSAAVVVKARKNEALQNLYNLLINNPSESYYISDKSKGRNSVGVRIDGEQKYMVFRDKSLADSLNGMSVEKADFLTKLYNWGLMGWMRKAYTTYNPEFFITNFARDIQNAIVTAMAEEDIEGGMANEKKITKGLIKNTVTAWGALAYAGGHKMVGSQADVNSKTQAYILEWENNGGKTGWAHVKTAEQIVQEITDKVNKKNTAASVAAVPFKKTLDFVEGVNEVFENSIRLGAFISAREAGMSVEKAAQLSKNITVNFNKYGEYGRVMNSIWLFFNAGVQGSARLIRSLFTMKPAKNKLGEPVPTYKRFHRAQYAMASLMTMNAVLTAFNISSSDEDEDGELFYNKIPDYEKERNLIIMAANGQNYYKIPMPYGISSFSSMGEAIGSTILGQRDAYDATLFTVNSIINSFVPVNFVNSQDAATSLIKSTAPSVLRPLLDMATNETYNGGMVTGENLPFGAKSPDSHLSKRAPEAVRDAFIWLNELSGGSENVSGSMDFNPDFMWYYMEYVVGAPFVFGSRGIQLARNAKRKAMSQDVSELENNEIIFLRKVYGEPSKYYDYNLYKSRIDGIMQLWAELKNPNVDPSIKARSGRYDGVPALIKINEKLINRYNQIMKILKSDVQKIDDPIKKQNELNRLYEEQRSLIMYWNKTYNETRGKD